MLDFAAATALRAQLTELPELLVYTHLALLPASVPRGGRVSGATREAPLPLRTDVLDLVVDTEQLLGSWAAAIRSEQRRANDWGGWLTNRRPGEAVVSVHLRYLLAEHEFAVTRDLAGPYAAEIDQLHRTLGRATCAAPRRPVRIPCPRCRLLTMAERPDGMRECANPSCVAVLRPSEYSDRAERLLTELHAA
ncbi:hypothetical protein P3T36_006881 [Kitasatospora sp. MAP12-15]|uniref:hypothetical protein n=1 Tax=unclassified Kitasatospora TaxID=2633591 RepID=UPI002475F6E0|nr:hypothetical protein [Kitasatospora sp. MAP12-44]MDH6111936.1 hypothetical protein [Kitasatospora sp. MAP12-44]